MMGNASNNDKKPEYQRFFSRESPFGIRNPESLRDPNETVFTIEQLEQMRNMDDVRRLALEYRHSDTVFATLWKSNKIHPEHRRLMRKLVQIQTINAVCNGFYRLSDGTRIQLDNDLLNIAAQDTKQYTNDYQYKKPTKIHKDPAQILIINGDCLEVARCIKKRYPESDPVVLNMANAYSPGGGWLDGCGAQEENLHRRSNLFQCLADSYNQFRNSRTWHYPIPEFGGLYSRDVSVFRGSENEGYPFFPDGPEYISFIACAAYANPRTRVDQNHEVVLADKSFISNTTKKMKTILHIAHDNNHDTVILSAFGCGAFRNPPGHIAKLFHQVINEDFLHSFKRIVFAIIEDHNAMQAHNRQGNIQPFVDVFHVPIILLNDIVKLV